jgi:hypothetical protein
MATPQPGHWFWRGVQSAIFYYVSCSPCLDRKYKKQRKREAKNATQELVTTEPGAIRQPTAFQTNEQWAEELILGPGPPKPWKPDEILARVKQKFQTPPDAPPRPSIDRRISNPFETVKESLKNTLHPDKWNWKRYDREDEMLWGWGDKVTKMLDKVTFHHEEPTGRKRAHTDDSDRDYTRGRIPDVNDLHPPVASRLPATREEAAWMILPPPSRAVMEGKQRPGDDTNHRKPLCVIGRPMREEVEAPEDEEETAYEERPSHDRHLSEPIPGRPPADNRHFSEPVQLLHPPLAVTTDSFISKPDVFDTKSDIFPLAGTVTPKSRPSSWQFHYIIPAQ